MYAPCSPRSSICCRNRFRLRNATGKSFQAHSDVCTARILSASDSGSLLASSHLAERTPQSQTITRCGDVSGAAGKESRRLSAQLKGPGGLLAEADRSRATPSGDGSDGSEHKTAKSPAGTV